MPNRGTFQDDIELFGLTYLQKISDTTTGGALHIEPAIWVTQPTTTQPAVAPPAGGQIVARMGSIPHGNALLARGSAAKFSGPPVSAPGGPTVPVSVSDSTGGIENLPFLQTNADAALVYATFWITKVTPREGRPFMQLQYAQFVTLDFPAILIPSNAAAPGSRVHAAGVRRPSSNNCRR